MRELADDKFKVIVLRPPMIYGRGSKGNYPLLAKLAKLSPIFPDVKNERSMLYIENLCELLCQTFLLKSFKRNTIVLIPQNKEWVSTTKMIKTIAKVNGNIIYLSRFLVPFIYILQYIPGTVGKMAHKSFGNYCYKKNLSKYEDIEYQLIGSKESILSTENKNKLKYKIGGNVHD